MFIPLTSWQIYISVIVVGKNSPPKRGKKFSLTLWHPYYHWNYSNFSWSHRIDTQFQNVQIHSSRRRRIFLRREEEKVDKMNCFFVYNWVHLLLVPSVIFRRGLLSGFVLPCSPCHDTLCPTTVASSNQPTSCRRRSSSSSTWWPRLPSQSRHFQPSVIVARTSSRLWTRLLVALQ